MKGWLVALVDNQLDDAKRQIGPHDVLLWLARMRGLTKRESERPASRDAIAVAVLSEARVDGNKRVR
jgi:hypothetical protein